MIKSKALFTIAFTVMALVAPSSVLASNSLSKDASLLSQARKAFKNGKNNKALDLYSSISKSSDLWATSLEETAWVHMKLNDYPKVLANTKTLLSHPLNQLGFYESYVLQSLAELRSCRYDSVFKTIESFKQNQRPRIISLESIVETKGQDMAKEFIHIRPKVTSSKMQLGPLLAKAPEFAHLDKKIQIELNRKTPRQNQVAKRLVQLANQELKEIREVVTKLRLIEVEAEQRVIRDYQSGFETKQNAEFKKTNYNQLIFTADERPWIDELGQFEVAMQSCVQQRRRL